MTRIMLLSFLFSLLLIVYQAAGQEETTLASEETNGNKEKRFVIENEYSPPLFGSFKFNALTNQFDLPDGASFSRPPGAKATTKSPYDQGQASTSADPTRLRSLDKGERPHERARSDERLKTDLNPIEKPNTLNKKNENAPVTTKVVISTAKSAK